MRNPWMSLWLSAANSWAGAMRGLWTAELHRQQTAMARSESASRCPRRSACWGRADHAPFVQPAAVEPHRIFRIVFRANCRTAGREWGRTGSQLLLPGQYS